MENKRSFVVSVLTDKALDDLIELSDVDDWHCCSQRNMRKAFKELKERRESDLRPADKFVDPNNICQQMAHIKSEVKEAYHEYCNLSEENECDLVEELIDIQMSCETMLADLGLDEQRRREARKRVIEKNRARGYYNV